MHKEVQNVEYLVAPDLAAGQSLTDPPQEHARKFLLDEHDLFGLKREEFSSRFFLKHTLNSRMGTHCIFGLRIRNVEVDDTCFVVHLDRSDYVVMVTSVLSTKHENGG